MHQYYKFYGNGLKNTLFATLMVYMAQLINYFSIHSVFVWKNVHVSDLPLGDFFVFDKRI